MRLSSENHIVTGVTTVLCLAFISVFGLVLQRAYVALRVKDKRKLSCLYIEIFVIGSSSICGKFI